jgi:hypothetical protein
LALLVKAKKDPGGSFCYGAIDGQHQRTRHDVTK